MTRCRLDRGQSIDDLQRILDASRTFHRLIVSLLDPATVRHAAGGTDLAEYRRTLRHDLRTPINAIKGYGEMLREDAADGDADALVADLDKLLGEATLLLDRIDGLVTFSGSDAPASDGTGAAVTEAGAPAKMVENLLKAVRPIAEKEADRAADTAQPDSGGGRQCVEPRPAVPPPATSGTYRAASQRWRLPRSR